MPRGKKIIIETTPDDSLVEQFRSVNLDDIKRERMQTKQNLSKSISTIFHTAKNLSKIRWNEDELEKTHGLYNVRAAYDYLKNKGVYISFRAFGGRIERGNVPYVKVGKKRFIPKHILDDIANLNQNFYTVRQAYLKYRKANPKTNFRAFIGRIEKGSIPSVKFETRRLIPRKALDTLAEISNHYLSVSEAIKHLHKNGIRIKRNAFERRLDRNRLPHVKVGGRRFVHQNVIQELVQKELNLRNKL